ncbi:hypothetical protein JOC85_001617 [Bacillus mesophilus]|uniref:Uncharacterized protein n=1 Tax=Bacillus mesophilus TaxID=1808955 RepID=A0A6M0Q787_9BACI|nr:hypothetical protein [Bacillus mesophilus]MBM7660845.1 hypothetical protein [Bacillus mesophilus]NEY71609.1 hypothetical protein [Bacillus mesophilus]
MKTKTKLLLIILLVGVTSLTLTKFLYSNEARESLTYFPIDPTLAFLSAETKLTLLNEKDSDEYIVEWESYSETDKKVYLRQDISFLYIDGVLMDSMSEWKEEVSLLENKKKLKGEDSSLLQSISLHHAEVHLQDDQIKSAQKMTSDHLYIIDSSFSPLESFRIPENKEHEEWKKILDHVIGQHLHYSWNELLTHFNLNRQQYHELTILDLVKYNEKSLPGLDERTSQKVMGQLWEGLYKNYLLGIKLSPNETISPIGSKIPLILLSKDGTHIYILIEGKNGEKIKLVQEI